MFAGYGMVHPESEQMFLSVILTDSAASEQCATISAAFLPHHVRLRGVGLEACGDHGKYGTKQRRIAYGCWHRARLICSERLKSRASQSVQSVADKRH